MRLHCSFYKIQPIPFKPPISPADGRARQISTALSHVMKNGYDLHVTGILLFSTMGVGGEGFCSDTEILVAQFEF